MDREIIRRRHLPHWDVPGAPYFVTSCLHGSISARGLLEIARFRNELTRRPKPAALSMAEWKVSAGKRLFSGSNAALTNFPLVGIWRIRGWPKSLSIRFFILPASVTSCFPTW